MKILIADKYKYIFQQLSIDKIKYCNKIIKGGEFYLPSYKGDSLKEVINTAAGIVGTIANVVSGGL